MREIKFRALSRDTKEWVYGMPLLGPTGWYMNFIDVFSGYVCDKTIKIVLDTIGQYTGLKDANGVEIYEGDIVDFPGKGSVVIWVIWDDSDARFALKSHVTGNIYALDMVHIEVIGNIHQKPTP